ncbi:hypothetical protein D3C85_1366040 [compost metagenome]
MVRLQDVVAQALIVDHHPLRRGIEDLQGDIGIRIDNLDLALPVDQQGGQGDDQDRSVAGPDLGGDYRLTCFAQAHVVGQQGAGPLQQMTDAGGLMIQQRVVR